MWLLVVLVIVVRLLGWCVVKWYVSYVNVSVLICCGGMLSVVVVLMVVGMLVLCSVCWSVLSSIGLCVLLLYMNMVL